VIELDVAARRLDVRLDAAELARRRSSWTPQPRRYPRGYGRLFAEHIQQANDGCDFDFLSGREPIPEPEIH
jgi:dihydroxyacid dehydratase/phosphogluconate dehydratase